MKLSKIEKQLDYYILRDGPISKYHNQSYLDQDIGKLENLGYRIVDFNTSKWTSKNCHEDLKLGLDFPDYYGENLNAFDDCLGDLKDTKRKGLVIVFRYFNDFVLQKKNYSEGILDIIANQSRIWLLNQKGLICLIHSTDSDLQIEKLGGISPPWNRNEWFDTDRKK